MSEVTLADLKKLDNMKMIGTENKALNDRSTISVSIDTRNLNTGQTYWAIRGERLDGHQFIGDAFDRGALLAVADRQYTPDVDRPLVIVPDTVKALQQLAANHRNKYDFPVIALTGSNGKTTTKEMICHLLGQALSVHKNHGNLNNHIGCPLTVLGMESKHEAAVLELGSNHPGEIAVLANIVQPNHALITNIGAAHLEFFGDKQGVYREKTSLFDLMPASGTIYLNLDDPLLEPYHRYGVNRITFAVNSDADFHGEIMGTTPEGCFIFSINNEIEVKLSIPGIHNVNNALAAAAVAKQLGLDWVKIKQGLESFCSYDKRLQVEEKNGIRIINDAYNSNPDSVRAALRSVADMPVKGRRFIALGDMFELGDNSPSAHREIIRETLGMQCDRLILMGDMMKQAAESITDERMIHFISHESAAEFLSANLRAGDLLLIKGSRGMAMEKILVLLGESRLKQLN